MHYFLHILRAENAMKNMSEIHLGLFGVRKLQQPFFSAILENQQLVA